MTTEEIKQAIEESIVPNNKKAISAQSLKNVLMALAENSGGSDEGLYFFGMYDYLNWDLIPTGDADLDESFSFMMEWNAMTYAKLMEVIDMLTIEYSTSTIPIHINIVSTHLGMTFIPAVVTLTSDNSTGELVFLITPCGDYRENFLPMYMDIFKEFLIGYTLRSDGSYSRFNPKYILWPEEGVTLPESLKEYNKKIYPALILNVVDASEIKIIYINEQYTEDEEALLSLPLNYTLDLVYAMASTKGDIVNVNNEGIIFSTNTGLHRMQFGSDGSPISVTNLIEFPEV